MSLNGAFPATTSFGIGGRSNLLGKDDHRSVHFQSKSDISSAVKSLGPFGSSASNDNAFSWNGSQPKPQQQTPFGPGTNGVFATTPRCHQEAFPAFGGTAKSPFQATPSLFHTSQTPFGTKSSVFGSSSTEPLSFASTFGSKPTTSPSPFVLGNTSACDATLSQPTPCTFQTAAPTLVQPFPGQRVQFGKSASILGVDSETTETVPNHHQFADPVLDSPFLQSNPWTATTTTWQHRPSVFQNGCGTDHGPFWTGTNRSSTGMSRSSFSPAIKWNPGSAPVFNNSAYSTSQSLSDGKQHQPCADKKTSTTSLWNRATTNDLALQQKMTSGLVPSENKNDWTTSVVSAPTVQQGWGSAFIVQSPQTEALANQVRALNAETAKWVSGRTQESTFKPPAATETSKPFLTDEALVSNGSVLVPSPTTETLVHQVRALVNEAKQWDKQDAWVQPNLHVSVETDKLVLRPQSNKPTYVPKPTALPTSAVKIHPRGYLHSPAQGLRGTLTLRPNAESKKTLCSNHFRLKLNKTAPTTVTETQGKMCETDATRIQNVQNATAEDSVPRTTTSKSRVPTLLDSGIEVCPSMEDLQSMSGRELAVVVGFSVKRAGVGMVEWEGAVDVRDLSIDKTVEIERRSISVYTRAEERGTKPPVGEQLNRPALLTFFSVFPKSGANAGEEERRKFLTKLHAWTDSFDAEFRSYSFEAGVWKVRVPHF